LRPAPRATAGAQLGHDDRDRTRYAGSQAPNVQSATAGGGCVDGPGDPPSSGSPPRAYLADEEGHESALALLSDPELATVTDTWTKIEVSGALVRAARSGRGDAAGLLELLDNDLLPEGPVTVIAMDQRRVESRALKLVREHALRAMDAWHLAVAELAVPALAEKGEEIGIASYDEDQATVAEQLGFTRI
jgi:predicted nucleic acid-binding protein